MDSAEKIKNNGLYLHATFTSHKTLANSLTKIPQKRKLVKEFVSVYNNAIKMKPKIEFRAVDGVILLLLVVNLSILIKKFIPICPC